MIVLEAYILYPLIFFSSLILSILSIPRIIYIAKRKKLFDVPDNKRKIHISVVPNLGGIGIFLSYLLVCSFFIGLAIFDKWNIIVVSSLVLFVTGVTDDMVGITPSKKFLAQFVASIITISIANIRITSLQGILGIYDMPMWLSISFTTVGCMFVTNALNLIDGIDGLAGSLGVLGSFILGAGLALTGNMGGACMAFGLMGSLIGFLRYNVSPAKIFMGDTGSLFTGFTLSILAILFIQSFNAKYVQGFNANSWLGTIVHSPKGALLVALSVLFVPVFDSFRVFLNRMRKGGSPFAADRTHLHHLLLDAGYNHSQAVSILVTSNIFIVTIALLVQDVNPNIGILCILSISMALFGILYYLRKNKMEKNQQLIAEMNKTDINMVGDLPVISQLQ
jgi:UDP-GlcNAc:undecaprenyl-phosphate GlcNAc-1-phosphate transferase